MMNELYANKSIFLCTLQNDMQIDDFSEKLWSFLR
jgi:hypothetical protein